MISAMRIAALLAALAMGAGSACSAGEAADIAANRVMVVAQDFVPLEQVLERVRASHPGHQLSVNGPAKRGGSYVYQIKWLTDEGAVLYIVVDAESGSILSVDGG